MLDIILVCAFVYSVSFFLNFELAGFYSRNNWRMEVVPLINIIFMSLIPVVSQLWFVLLISDYVSQSHKLFWSPFKNKKQGTILKS
jgi:hypothetical protein